VRRAPHDASRSRNSHINFLNNLVAGLIAYSHRPKKPALDPHHLPAVLTFPRCGLIGNATANLMNQEGGNPGSCAFVSSVSSSE
jgi:hypothetical protein